MRWLRRIFTFFLILSAATALAAFINGLFKTALYVAVYSQEAEATPACLYYPLSTDYLSPLICHASLGLQAFVLFAATIPVFARFAYLIPARAYSNCFLLAFLLWLLWLPINIFLAPSIGLSSLASKYAVRAIIPMLLSAAVGARIASQLRIRKQRVAPKWTSSGGIAPDSRSRRHPR